MGTLMLKGIRKSFAGVQALKGVDFELRAAKFTLWSARTVRASPP